MNIFIRIPESLNGGFGNVPSGRDEELLAIDMPLGLVSCGLVTKNESYKIICKILLFLI